MALRVSAGRAEHLPARRGRRDSTRPPRLSALNSQRFPDRKLSSQVSAFRFEPLLCVLCASSVALRVSAGIGVRSIPLLTQRATKAVFDSARDGAAAPPPRPPFASFAVNPDRYPAPWPLRVSAGRKLPSRRGEGAAAPPGLPTLTSPLSALPGSKTQVSGFSLQVSLPPSPRSALNRGKPALIRRFLPRNAGKMIEKCPFDPSYKGEPSTSEPRVSAVENHRFTGEIRDFGPFSCEFGAKTPRLLCFRGFF